MPYRIRTIKTTVADQAAMKTVLLPASDKIIETDEQRIRRLKAQAAANRIRVTNNGDGTYTVTSQRKAADGTRGETHDIKPVNGLWVCSCRWGEIHPGSECAAIAQLRSYRKRKHLSPDPDLTTQEAARRARDARSEELEAESRKRSAELRRLHPRTEEV